jgi:hypothetical protein
MQYPAGYPASGDSPFELSPRRLSILLAIALAAFFAGRSMGGSDGPSSVTGERAGVRGPVVSQRLRAVPGIPNLKVAEPAPEPTTSTPTTPTTPSTSPPTSSPAPSSPAPAPAPAPSQPSAPSGGGGGGSFDDSG